VGRKRCFLKRYAEKLASRRLIGLSVLQQYKFFYVILRRSTRKVWQNIFNHSLAVAGAQHSLFNTQQFHQAHRLHNNLRNMSQTLR
jgi:hypothetical protein